jgi:bifunctional DNase/RNase
MAGDGWVTMRPEGICQCPEGRHPVLVLRETTGRQELRVRLDEDEARHLRHEFDGTRTRHSRTYETIERLIAGLGGTIGPLRLVGDRHKGLAGEIEVTVDRRRTRVRAHPGDVATLAHRLELPVLVAAEVLPHGAGAPLAERKKPRAEATPGAASEETRAFRRFLEQVGPEDFRP